jgi:hypothetical protein
MYYSASIGYSTIEIVALAPADSVMRDMNLPPLARPPSDVEGCWTLYLSRLGGAMPLPEASLLLVAYMAWPNDEEERNRWMATAIAFFVADQVPAPWSGQDMFQLFGGLRAVADSSFSPMMEKLVRIQDRWRRVADVMQMVVDLHHDKRGPIRGGASISKALDVLQNYNALPVKSRLSRDWSDFRDVAHLVAAAAAIAAAGQQRTEQVEAAALLTAVLYVPEVVLALGLAYQRFGVSFRPRVRSDPILPPETLWCLPADKDTAVLPLPVRRLSDADFDYLTKHRRAAPKRGTAPRTV